MISQRSITIMLSSFAKCAISGARPHQPIVTQNLFGAVVTLRVGVEKTFFSNVGVDSMIGPARRCLPLL